MRSFIEIIYIDSEDQARKTDMQNHGSCDAETWQTFNGLRPYAVDIKSARFLLDYHNRKGDLADTIPIDADGFVNITGRQPKSEADYVKIDADYWNAVRKDQKAA